MIIDYGRSGRFGKCVLDAIRRIDWDIFLRVDDRKVGYLHHVLTIALRAALTGDEVGLEGSRTTVYKPRPEDGRVVYRFPHRIGRFDYQPCVQAVMLVAARTKMVVGEHRAKRAILAKRVDQRIGPPSLNVRLRSDPGALVASSEEWMDLGGQYLIAASLALEQIVGVNSFAHRFW